MSRSTHAFGRITGSIDTPMFVVTAFDGHDRDGCLVGFATQGSIHPPRFLACLSVENRTTRIARDARVLAVHVLRADQRQLAELFGGETGDEVDKLARVAWHEGPEGAAVIDGCDWFAGNVLTHHTDLGDHEGFVIDVLGGGFDAPTHDQLGFQAVRGIEPGHPA
jgi:flavin reductase (DIM6/NTAB) family NADH-FMN oxidoreductase RutF